MIPAGVGMRNPSGYTSTSADKNKLLHSLIGHAVYKILNERRTHNRQGNLAKNRKIHLHKNFFHTIFLETQVKN